MSCIAIIPARIGSSRIKKKNIKEFHGKPIIAYSIETAKSTGLFDEIVVSTDDDEIGHIAKQYGAKIYRRPKALAEDDVGTLAVTKDAALFMYRQGYHAQYVCCIYATAPLMSAKDLIAGFDVITKQDCAHVISVGYPPLRDAGQWYWSRVFALALGVDYFDLTTIPIRIPNDRVCDINTLDDWQLAEEMYSKQQVTTRCGNVA